MLGTRREGRKEMQRLPYNGGPRAHKLRHDVIPSSLFNERWQPLYVYTRVRYTRGWSSHPRPSSTTRLPDSLTLPTFPGELVASPARCVVKSVKRNPPTYPPLPPRDNFPTTPPRIESHARFRARYNRR